MYESIFEPLKIGKLSLKNRIIFAPTTMGLGEEEYLERLRGIAEGGCAMIIIGDVPVGKHGPFSLHGKKSFLRYQKICETIHSSGCLACAQLHQSDSNWKAMLKYLPGALSKKISPDEMRRLLNQQVGELVTGMKEEKLKEILDSFGSSAILAVKAGFDMIQVHGDRMCGSFSSSLYNHRTDRFGGSPENRARFAVEAVRSVREALPEIPIDYKLPVRQENPHYGNAGVLVEELPVFVPMLEQAGANSFHVTLANHGELSDTIPPRSHPYFWQEGCFLDYCDEVRKYTKLPICGVGGLSLPEFVEEALKSGRIDCAAMSRQLLADPKWPQKVKEGKEKEIRRCIRCNKECLGGMKQHKGVHCIYDKEDQKQ